MSPPYTNHTKQNLAMPLEIGNTKSFITALQKNDLKHNRLNVGRIALKRLVGAVMNCSLLQLGGGGGGGAKKFNSGLQITTLEANIYHY